MNLKQVKQRSKAKICESRCRRRSLAATSLLSPRIILPTKMRQRGPKEMNADRVACSVRCTYVSFLLVFQIVSLVVYLLFALDHSAGRLGCLPTSHSLINISKSLFHPDYGQAHLYNAFKQHRHGNNCHSHLSRRHCACLLAYAM